MASEDQDRDQEKVTEDFTFDGERPHFSSPAKAYKFTTGEDVYIYRNGSKEGPYKIQQPKDGKYILCDASYRVVEGGRAFEESELVLYDPFG